MDAVQKILEQIEKEAKQTAEALLAEASAQAEAVENGARAQAKEICSAKTADALKKADALKTNAQSSAELIVRDAKLERKRKEIEQVLKTALDSLRALSDEAYFDRLTAMAAKAAGEGRGVLLLGREDLARNTALLEAKLAAAGVNAELGGEAADIQSGFILKYGDIEFNLSFESLIHEKREQLEDTVNRILFAD